MLPNCFLWVGTNLKSGSMFTFYYRKLNLSILAALKTNSSQSSGAVLCPTPSSVLGFFLSLNFCMSCAFHQNYCKFLCTIVLIFFWKIIFPWIHSLSLSNIIFLSRSPCALKHEVWYVYPTRAKNSTLPYQYVDQLWASSLIILYIYIRMLKVVLGSHKVIYFTYILTFPFIHFWFICQ